VPLSATSVAPLAESPTLRTVKVTGMPELPEATLPKSRGAGVMS
jgi:hypothetical protein